MGINYYIESFPPCPKCGHIDTRMHLGKYSYGNPFLFRANFFDETLIDSWYCYEHLLTEGLYLIKDESGQVVYLKDFKNMLKNHIVLDEVEFDWKDRDGYRFRRDEFS